MKKIKLLLLLAIVAVLFSFTACGDSGYKQMTVDVNPSVEFMLDTRNKVVSVTAANDDGSILVYGEDFIGLSAEDAAAKIVSLATEFGYITKDAKTTVRVTVNGEDANAVYQKVSAKVSKAVGVALERGESLTHDALAAAVAALRADELDLAAAKAKTDKELLEILAEERKETANILSSALRDAYYEAKEQKIDLVRRESTKSVIEGLGNAYASFLSGYDTILSKYDMAIAAVEDARIRTLIDADSTYQKALKALMETKKTYLEQKKAVAELEDGSMQKKIAEALLETYRIAFTAAEAACNTAYGLADSALTALLNAMKDFREQLVALEEQFPTEIRSALTEAAAETERKMNEAKDAFFEEFESMHDAQIRAYNEMIAGLKAKAQKN